MKFSLISSALAHLALLGLALWLVNYSKNNLSTSPEEFVVVAVDSSGANSHSTKNSQKTKRASPSHKKPRFNFGLVPRSKNPETDPGSDHGQNADSDFAGGSGREENDGYAQANRMKIEEESQQFPYFQAVWKKVNAGTAYPSELAEQHVEGKSTLQLGIDYKGVFTGEVHSVRGPDPMLSSYALVTTIQALRNPLPQNLWRKDPQSGEYAKPMLIVFEFDFKVHDLGTQSSRLSGGFDHFKNIMKFQRDTYVENRVSQAINHFFTRIIPPIIPIPGGAFIDFIRTYQYFSNLMHPTPDGYEIRSRRLELKAEQWKQFLKKSVD